MKKYIILFGVACALFVYLLYLLVDYKPLEKKRPFTILISREPDNLSFLYSRQGVSLYVEKALFRGLVELDYMMRPYAALAEVVPSIENGLVRMLPGGRMEVEWRLRLGLRWSDGQKLGIKDIIFTYNLLKNPAIHSFSSEKTALSYIESVRADGESSFIVVWKRPYYNYLYAHPILPKHILSKFLDKPDKFRDISYHRNPVGSGPYRLKEWRAGTYLLLERNPYYHKTVNLEELAFKVVKDVNSLLINLLSGEGDACATLSPSQYAFLRTNYKDKIKLWTTKSMGWLHIDLNLENPFLSNKNVRKALLHSIDRLQIIKSIKGSSVFSVARSWLSPKHYAYHKPSISYDYNIGKAKELLYKEGFRLNDRGFLEKDKRVFSLSLITDSKDSTRRRIALFIKEYLRKVGIDLKIKVYTSQVIFSKLLPERQFDMALYAWYMNPSVDGELYWASYKIPRGSNIGLNFGGFENAAIDKIHKKLHYTVSNKERIKLFKRHQEIWKKELPALPLYVPYSISATKKRLINFKLTGSSIPFTWNCEDWQL